MWPLVPGFLRLAQILKFIRAIVCVHPSFLSTLGNTPLHRLNIFIDLSSSEGGAGCIHFW